MYDNRPTMMIVVERDDIDRKEFQVAQGDEAWLVVIEREIKDDRSVLWCWYFYWNLLTVPFGPAPTYEWPTWEQAFEDALSTIRRISRDAEMS